MLTAEEFVAELDTYLRGEGAGLINNAPPERYVLEIITFYNTGLSSYNFQRHCLRDLGIRPRRLIETVLNEVLF